MTNINRTPMIGNDKNNSMWILNIAAKEIQVDWPNHALIGRTYHEITERHQGHPENLTTGNPNGNPVQPGLTLGLAGIGLMELLLPGVLSGKCSSDLNKPEF